MTASEDARLKRIRAISFAFVFAGVLVVFALRTRGVRYIGPLPTLVLIWFPWLAGTAVEYRAARAPRARWIFWFVGLAIFVGLTFYLHH